MLQLATGLKYAKHADSLADMRLSSVLGELYHFFLLTRRQTHSRMPFQVSEQFEGMSTGEIS